MSNAVTAYTALNLSGLNVPEEAIRKGFAEVKWPCRFEIASTKPTVILDSAHNQDSFVKLRETLDEYFPRRQVILILGASEDKSLAEMLNVIKPKLSLLIATKADHPRALEPEKVIEVAGRIQVRAEAVAPVSAALARALELAANGDDIILSAGSMFVTAEVKTAWEKIHLAKGANLRKD